MFIGTAGWSIPSEFSGYFPNEGSHLQRYSKIFNAVEINSSFYKDHLPRTYSRWATEVPEDFRFSVKIPKAFIHDCGLRPGIRDMKQTIDVMKYLGVKLGVFLIQVPGSMNFCLRDAERFFSIIRKNFNGPMVLEPRNTTWVSADAQKLLLEFGVSKVVADPDRCPGGKKKVMKAAGFSYHRLHGSPVIYRSLYTEKFLKGLLPELKNNSWCIFDNTTLGQATKNALDLMKKTTQRK